MIYLKNFIFPSIYTEDNFLGDYYGKPHTGNTYHCNMYPFRVLSDIGLFRMDFEPITIFYGGNGSGKSTALNVISQKLHVSRNSAYNSGMLMENYVELCSYGTNLKWADEEFDVTGTRSMKYDIGDFSYMITSDDIFKALLQQRVDKDQKLLKSRMLTEKASDIKYGRWQDFKFAHHLNIESGENMQKYKDACAIRKKVSLNISKTDLARKKKDFPTEKIALYICQN